MKRFLFLLPLLLLTLLTGCMEDYKGLMHPNSVTVVHGHEYGRFIGDNEIVSIVKINSIEHQSSHVDSKGLSRATFYNVTKIADLREELTDVELLFQEQLEPTDENVLTVQIGDGGKPIIGFESDYKLPEINKFYMIVGNYIPELDEVVVSTFEEIRGYDEFKFYNDQEQIPSACIMQYEYTLDRMNEESQE